MSKKSMVRTRGLYAILNLINNKYYIGMSMNIYRRMEEHLCRLDNNSHPNKHLQNAWNKYEGRKNFIIYPFFLSDNITKEELEQKEIYEITQCFGSFENGYNKTKGGNCISVHTEKSKREISIKAKIRQSLPEVKERLKRQNTGERNPYCKLRDEEVQQIRENVVYNKNKTKILNAKELANKYGVSITTIRRIVKKKSRVNKTQYQ